MNTLFKPPRLHSLGDAGEERHATWLELFYDLIFVVAVSQLANRLDSDVSPRGVLGFVVLFVPVWWCWIGATFYATRFDTDDLGHRLLTMVQMFLVAALSVQVHGGLASTSRFALLYAAIRAVLVFQYARAGRHVPVARALTTRYAVGFAVAAAIWAASAFVPVPWRFGMWAVGFVVDFGTPMTAGTLHVQLPPHVSHVAERFGLFVLIVLGESATAVAAGLAGQHLGTASALVALLSIHLAFSLWWIYFENLDTRALWVSLAGGRIRDYQAWLYTHLPLVIAITATSVGVRQLIAAPQDQPLAAAPRWLFCGAVAACLAAVGRIRRAAGVCERATLNRAISRWAVAGAGVVLAQGFLGGPLPPLGHMALVSAVCAALVLLQAAAAARVAAAA